MSIDGKFNTIADQLNSGILILDLELNIVSWNRFFAIHANQKLADVVGKSVFDVFSELPKRWFERKVACVTQLNTTSFCSWEQRHHLFELPHTRPITTGSHFMAQNCTFSPITENGVVTGICVLIEDVTDVCYYQSTLEKTLQELARSNRIDGLTQIYNRKHWEECLTKEFSRAQRYGSQLSLLMLDLDSFKKLNDSFGHQCGDQVLIETTKRITNLLRAGDLFGRYGGEEFAIILPETDVAGASDVAERVRKIIALTPIQWQEQAIDVSISIGVATLSDKHERYEQLISDADSALYQAKSSGRNQTCSAENV